MASGATAVWTGSELDFAITGNSGYTVDVSSVKDGETGSPMELLLQSMVGCTAMDVISILKKKRQDVTGFEVNVSAERAPEHPRKYTAITLEYVVTGNGVDPAAVARSIELSETRYCSVMATFHDAGVPVSTSYRVVEAGTA